MRGSARTILAAAGIVAVTLVAYVPAMRGGFVWDDDVLLYNNRLIKASDGLYRFWFTVEPYDYLPLTWTSLWLEWRAWGENPIGYHVTNVLLHAGASVLMYLALRRLAVPSALAAAMIFAVHPVNVASVAWISERKNTLSMVFYLLTLLFYLRFDEGRSRRWYALALAAFVLALLSKSAVVMAPVVLLGFTWWRRGRIARRDLLATVPFFALSLVAAAVTVWFQTHRAIGEMAVRPEGFPARLATAGVAPWFYLYKALVPVNLVMIYPRWNVDAASPLSYLPGMCLVAALVAFWLRRRTWGRAPLLGLGYFVVTLFPVLGFFEMSFAAHSLVADHFQYFAIAGPIALLSGVIRHAAARLGRRGIAAAAILAAGAVGLLGCLTWHQGRIYKSDETMWQDVNRRNPLSPEGWYNQGRFLANKGRTREAILHYRKALELRPCYSEAHNNLACDLAEAGQFAEAMYHFTQAVACKGDNLDARYNLALALSRAGRSAEAITQYREILRASKRLYSPEPPDALNGLAEILATHRDPNVRNGAEAIALAQRACAATEFRDPDMLKTLAAAYAETGQFDKALQTARQAERLSMELSWDRLTPLIRRDIELYTGRQPLREGPPSPAGASAPGQAK